MENPNRLNESLTSPRLLDTTLCPFSTTKKSIAHTYNNQSLYIASIQKDYEESTITDCRTKLKIRKVILDSTPECIKDPTKKLLARVGENEPILESLLKFYRSLIPTIHSLQNNFQKEIEENTKLRAQLGSPQSQKQILVQSTNSKENQLQMKIQKLQATIIHLIDQQPESSSMPRGRISLAKNQTRLTFSLQKEKKALFQALQENTKLRQQKQNYYYMMNNFKYELERLKQQKKKEEIAAASSLQKQSVIHEDIQNLKSQIEDLKRYRELFYMCRQQKQQLITSHSIDNTRSRNNEKQIRKLKEKLLNLSSLIGRNDCQVIQNQEKDAIEKIKEELINNQGFRKCTEQEFKMIQKYQTKETIYDVQQSKYHEGLNIYYPSFFSLLTEDMKQFEVELKISFTKAITADLFLRIRAIMDSKYNQLIIQSESCHTRFTDFVFGWFQKFQVNNQTKRIIEHTKPRIQSQYNKKNFLIGLFNPKIQKLNEILTFRQFLLGQSSEDEIFYYLQCRALFFKGSQLDHFISASDTIVFLQHQFVLKQIGMITGKYPKQVQNIIIYNINLRRKKKFNGYFVDVAFVLRTLIEVYRAYKRQKCEKMKLVTMKLQNTLGAKQIKFVYFRELIELNFPKTTVSKISFMYRQTINLYKNNKIDFFGAFYAAAHEKLFIYSIKQDFYNMQLSEGKSTLNISATLPPTLGLQGLTEELKFSFGTGVVDMCSQHNLLYKMIRVLFSKQQNKGYQSKLKQKLKLSLQSHLLDIKAMTENMNNRDNKIQKAATKLTRSFRYRIKLYYDKFLQRINSKIDEINKLQK